MADNSPLISVIHVNLAKGFRGGERQTSLLIEALSAYPNVTQALACRKDSPLRTILSGVKELHFIDADHQLQGHFCAFKADIVHAHEAKSVHWAYLHKCIRKTPYILTRRVDTPVKNKWSNRLTYTSAARAVAISTPIAHLLEQCHWTDIQIVPSVMAQLARNPVATETFRTAYEGKFLVGHAGALVDKHKGQRTLIQSARILKDKLPQLQFLFFGQGEDEQALKAESIDLENVHWMGFKENIGDYLRGLDLFAFPSRNEGLGSTLLDVMDAGVPIVASKVGGIPDIIRDGETGRLVPPNDPEALASRIEELYLDSNQRRQLVSGAEKLLINFTPQKMAESYLGIYTQIRQG